MIYNDNKPKLVQLPTIPPAISDEFGIADVARRDAIAAQIMKDIDEASRQYLEEDDRRTHLGASAIGHKCDRFIWFAFRWMKQEQFSGRVLRLFNRGHEEETRLIKWLSLLGFEVEQVDPATGKQFRFSDCNGHFGGSCDGMAALPVRYGISDLFPNSKVLLEFKTANENWFEKMTNSGVIKVHEKYWVQSCIYGYKLGLKYDLFIYVNKNNDDITVELLELNHELGKQQIDRANRIINSYYPPERISENASYWECRFCPMLEVCHFKAPVEKNCRSCQFCQPVEDAQWKCHKYQNIIPSDFIAKGCSDWQPLPR